MTLFWSCSETEAYARKIKFRHAFLNLEIKFRSKINYKLIIVSIGLRIDKPKMQKSDNIDLYIRNNSKLSYKYDRFMFGSDQ